jgi:hypothetical protein
MGTLAGGKGAVKIERDEAGHLSAPAGLDYDATIETQPHV